MANTIRTAAKAAAFCEALTATCNVGQACKAAGIGRTTAYEWREADPAFAAAWDRAARVAVSTLEDEAHRRAFDGVAEPVVHKGEFSYEWEAARDTQGDVIREEDGSPKMVPALDADGKPRLKTIQRYSDTLLMFMLKAHRPDKYRENSKVELSGSLDLRNVSDADLEAELAQLTAQLAGAGMLSGTDTLPDDSALGDDAADLV